MDFFKSAVASAISKGPPFPYTFGERLDNEQSVWTLYNGTRKEDGSNCSIFSFDVRQNGSRLPLARNAVRKLKTLRHPGIVKILESVETDTYIYVATERVTPLTWDVRRKAVSEETAKWGLYTIAATLKFIHEEGSSVHGSLRVSSLYTSESGEWRIGGLDVLSSMKEDDAIIYTYGNSVPDITRYMAPEVAQSGWAVLKKGPIAAFDSYAYGLLIYEVFNQGEFGADHVAVTKGVPPSMHNSYKRMLQANPKARMTVSNFLDQGTRNGGFFQTSLIRLSQNIDSFGLKDENERNELLGELKDSFEDLPESFFKMKVLPELLKSVEFGGGGPKVFSYVMQIGQKLSSDEWEQLLSPFILRLFGMPDRQIRVCLLEALPSMIDHFTQSVVTNKMFPQIVLGFTDAAPVVREQTLRSILTIITKLTDRVINGELLKYLAKTAQDEQPGIRTNTMVCLGKIAHHLGPNTRQKVLINAFTHSLKDPYPMARSASLQALAATSTHFPEDQCATRLLPAICTVLIDKEKVVRDQANKAFEIYARRIRQYADTLPDTLQPSQVGTNGRSSPNPPNATTAQTSSDSSWSGWALSSLASKLAAASGEMQSRPSLDVPSSQTRSQSSPAVAHELQRTPSTASASASVLARHATSRTITAQSLTPATPSVSTPRISEDNSVQADEDAAIDAWADFGDMDDIQDEPAVTSTEATSPALSFTATMPAVKSPAANPYANQDEPDFAGWLAQQSAAKSKLGASAKALPKGLSKTGTNTRPAITATKTAPSKVVTAPKPKAPIDTKPKESADGDDDWGDAWG